MRAHLHIPFAVLALGGFALSCGGETPGETASNAKNPAAAANSKAKADKAAATPSAENPVYTYSPVGKRDPFQSYLAELSASEEISNKRRLEETEMFEIDQYKLTALITGTSQARAMVEDPSGKGHALRLGSHLGKNGGLVTRINSTEIVVTEELRSATGEKMRVPITIKLPQPDLDINIETGKP